MPTARDHSNDQLVWSDEAPLDQGPKSMEDGAARGLGEYALVPSQMPHAIQGVLIRGGEHHPIRRPNGFDRLRPIRAVRVRRLHLNGRWSLAESVALEVLFGSASRAIEGARKRRVASRLDSGETRHSGRKV